MLKQRIITALILAPLALYAILFLPIFWFLFSGELFTGLLVLISDFLEVFLASKFRRCALPITAFRVVSPSILAIWLPE